MFQNCNVSTPEEQQPDHDQNGQQKRHGKLENKSEEGWRGDPLLLGDSFDHEVRTVADVGGRAEKHGGDADGQDVTGVSGEQAVDVLRTGHPVQRA